MINGQLRHSAQILADFFYAVLPCGLGNFPSLVTSLTNDRYSAFTTACRISGIKNLAGWLL